MPSTDQLIARLGADGDPVARGEFTLDRARALEKMRRSQLAHPQAYVLELVQCACLRGATGVDFSIDADDVVCEFDGTPFSAEELAGLDDALLADREARALHELAIGVNVATSLNPRFVRVESGGCRWERRPGAPDRSEPLRPERRGTRVHVKDRLTVGLLAELVRHLVKGAAEEDFLRARCAWSAVPIRLDGRRLSQPFDSFATWGRVSIQADGARGAGGFEAGEKAELLLVKDGVWIDTRPLEGGPLPFRAVVEGRDLVKDLSQAGIVQDQAFQAVVQHALAARPAAVAGLCRQAVSRPKIEAAFQEAFRQELLSVAGLEALREGPREGYPRCLADLRVWPTATGEGDRVPFTALLETMDSFGVLPYSVEPFLGRSLPGAAHVLLSKDWGVFEKLCTLLGGRIRNVTRRLANQARYERTVAPLRSRRMEPRLESSRRLLAVRKLSGGGLEGEAALADLHDSPRLRFVRQGTLLYEMRLPTTLQGIQAVLEGDFSAGRGGYGLERDAACARALLAVFGELTGMFEELAAGRRLRREATFAVVAFLHLATGPDPQVRFLEACGVAPELARREAEGVAWRKPDLGPGSSSPLACFPWIPRPGGRRAFLSVADLHEEVRSGGSPTFVLADGTPLSHALRGHALRGRALWLGEREREVLERVLGPGLLVAAGAVPVAPAGQESEAEEAFLEALRRFLRRDDPTLPFPLDLARLDFAGDAASPEEAAVACRGETVLLRRGHPLVRQAVASASPEPGLVALVASLVGSALNRLYLEVTGDHEAALQVHLGSVLAGSVSVAAPAAASAPSGGLDPISPAGEATGWASDPGDPERRVAVRLYLDGPLGQGRFAGSVVAEAPRTEPESAAGHGFQVPLPPLARDGHRHRVFAYAVSADGGYHELPGSPRNFCGPAPWTASPIGYLDVVEGGGAVRGWALDPNSPDRSIGIHFYMDGPPGVGEFVGGVDAGLPRGDVNEHTGYPGDHGFEFQVPAEHLDGLPHTLHAYGLDPQGGHNPELSGSPKSFGG